jgi:hypothetical protein
MKAIVLALLIAFAFALCTPAAHADQPTVEQILRMRHWTLVTQTLDVHSGEVTKEQSSGDYDTAGDCNAAQVGKLESARADGVRVYFCRHQNDEQGT